MPKSNPVSVATECVRTAQHAPILGEPTAPPIPQTTAWAFKSLEDADEAWSRNGGSELYARLGTPLHAALEKSMAALERADAACVFATGMAAMVCTLETLCPPGSHLLVSQDLYGSTDVFLDGALQERRVRVSRVNMMDLGALDVALQDKPTCVLLEVLTNPTLNVLRLDEIVKRCHAAGALVVVDSTFTPPTLLQPILLGADLVHHSASKSLSGHGDVSAGVVSGGQQWMDKIRARRSIMGAHLGVQEAFLMARGIRTLHLRTQQAAHNALFLAHALENARAQGKLPSVRRVIHPALPGHPNGVWLGQQTQGVFGMMVGLELSNGNAAASFVRALTNIRLVPSLGDICTTVAVPARSSHRALTPEDRARRGISDGFVRISLGTEDAADIWAELKTPSPLTESVGAAFMEHTFWQTRWQDGQIGFHESGGNRLLQRFAGLLGSGRRILVPMCGKSADLLYLRSLGHDVVGIEFVPVALEQFAAEHPELGVPSVDHALGFPRYVWPGLTLLAANIFDVKPADVGLFDGVYDRAAMVALNPPDRKRYALWLENMTRDNGGLLLVVLNYDQTRTEGPPFSVDAAEAGRALGSFCTTTLLAEEPALSGGRIREQGIPITERCYWVERFLD